MRWLHDSPCCSAVQVDSITSFAFIKISVNAHILTKLPYIEKMFLRSHEVVFCRESGLFCNTATESLFHLLQFTWPTTESHMTWLSTEEDTEIVLSTTSDGEIKCDREMQLHMQTCTQTWGRGPSGSRGKYYPQNNGKLSNRGKRTSAEAVTGWWQCVQLLRRK